MFQSFERVSLDQLRAEPTLLAQLKDELLDPGIQLGSRRPLGAAAAANQPLRTESLVAAPPFPKGGTRDPAPAADLACILTGSIELDPSTPGLRPMIHGAKLYREASSPSRCSG